MLIMLINYIDNIDILFFFCSFFLKILYRIYAINTFYNYCLMDIITCLLHPIYDTIKIHL